MPTPQEIMDEIRKGLDGLPSASRAASKKYRTEAIKAKLCEIGRNGFQDTRFKVCAALPRGDRDYGEWLYARLCTNLVKSVRVTGRLHQALQIDPRDFYPLGIGR